MSKVKPFKPSLTPGCVLSPTFRNTRNCYKVVDQNNVLGYGVVVDPNGGACRITPLYHALIYYTAESRKRSVLCVASAYEHGEPLNAWTAAEDDEGSSLARIAADAIARLERRTQDARSSRSEASRRTTPRRRR